MRRLKKRYRSSPRLWLARSVAGLKACPKSARNWVILESFGTPKRKMPEFSMKKSRFSGKKRLKRVRLTCWMSASTCEKSVFAVRSRFSPVPTSTLASTPRSAEFMVPASESAAPWPVSALA